MSENKPNFVGIWLAAAALVVCSLTLYVQLLHERDHEGANYMPIVLSIILFVVSVGVVASAVYRNLRDANRAKSLHVQIETLREKCQDQSKSEELREAQARDRPSDRQEATLFTPLQIDALKLRRDLQLFLKEIGPERTFNSTQFVEDSDRNAASLAEWHNAVVPFRNELKAKYALRFRESAIRIYHQFSAEGITDHHLATLADTARSVAEVQDLIDTLWKVAGQRKEVPDGKD